MAAQLNSDRRATPERGPFHASFVLGHVRGIEIGATWSWLIVVWLIGWSLAGGVFPDEAPGLADGTYAVMAVAATAIFFASLLLHELGHALVAQREGMQISGITLWLFGGVARFEGMFPSAMAELRIALAGPAVTLVLVALFLGSAEVVSISRPADAVIMWVGRINLLLLAFNMLPALPLDGGRVLRALVWQATGDFTRATRTCGVLGRAFGTGLAILGALTLVLAGALGGLWLIVLGLFLSAAAQAEASLATTRAALAGLRVRDAMVREPDVLPGELSVADFVAGSLRTQPPRRLPGARERHGGAALPPRRGSHPTRGPRAGARRRRRGAVEPGPGARPRRGARRRRHRTRAVVSRDARWCSTRAAGSSACSR